MLINIKNKFSIIIIFIILLVTYVGAADKWSDYWEVGQSQGPTQANETNQKIPGVFKSASLIWIKAYQKGISSQDLPSCVFHPSCSHFAVNAIRRYGFAKGWLLAGDRLLRCNPFAKHYYPQYYGFDGEKLVDPVIHYSNK